MVLRACSSTAAELISSLDDVLLCSAASDACWLVLVPDGSGPAVDAAAADDGTAVLDSGGTPPPPAAAPPPPSEASRFAIRSPSGWDHARRAGLA